MQTIAELRQALAARATSSRDLVEEALARAAAPEGEGERVFTKLHAERGRAEADAQDRLCKAGVAPGPLAGIPISIKDLFDVAGETTLAGSVALEGAPPAARDATVVQRLRQAGAVIVGRTNMTEFAFSGLGINPHYGTPLNPWDRPARRIPGGSSSGAAVSVADGMAAGALGTDTGGSVRIPAALCGLAGLKPTASRIPQDGVVPLSTTLDSVGPLAWSVACCALLDAVMAGEEPVAPVARTAAGLALGAPVDYVRDGMDETVSGAFERALGRLSAAGVRIVEIRFPAFARIAEASARGGFAAPEAYAWHRTLIERAGDRYDPRVLSRILRGKDQPAADYVDLRGLRRAIRAEAARGFADWDALVMPTVPVVAPRLGELQTDEAYARLNMLILRNPSTINFLDGCALTLPCHAEGEAPVGLMLAAATGADRALLEIGAAVEAALASG